jgi:glutamine cyclotransferase
MKLLSTKDSPVAEGWGLTERGNRLILSDGSDTLYYLDPTSLAIQKKVRVRDGTQPQNLLNELEFVKPHLYANVFTHWEILRIDPDSGCVTGRLNLLPLLAQFAPSERTALVNDSERVPNGIAYDASREEFFVTGKLWPLLFVIKVKEEKK